MRLEGWRWGRRGRSFYVLDLRSLLALALWAQLSRLEVEFLGSAVDQSFGYSWAL